MAGLVVLWFALFVVLVGWGLLVISVFRRVGGSAFDGSLSAFQTMWLGYAGLLAFLLICSLVLPIGRGVLAASLAPAIAGYVLQRRAVIHRLRALPRRRRTLLVLTCAIVASTLAVAYVACDVVGWYDTGLYHLQAVKWTSEFPTVPGLANLHVRFGYNNSVHVFGAYVDAYWEGVACHSMNGFLLAVALAQWCTEILGPQTPRGRLRQTFCLLTLPFLLGTLWRTTATCEVSSLSSDLALAVVSFALVLEMVSLHRDRRVLHLGLIVALGGVAVTTKLGGLGMFAGSVLLALVATWRLSWRIRVAIFALPALLVLGWTARGVILSGWLLFPVFGKLGVPWAVPRKVGHEELLTIKSWGRMFGHGPAEVFGHGVWFWLRPWLEMFKQTRECVLAGISGALLVWRALHGSMFPIVRAGERAAIAACMLGVAQWFVGAPDLRYGAYLFWLLPAAILAPMLASAMRSITMRTIVCLLALYACGWNGGFAIRGNAVVPEVFGRPIDPHVPPTQWMNAGPDTRVLAPTVTDQCFDADLPCSPVPGKARMRDPGSLGAGFAAR